MDNKLNTKEGRLLMKGIEDFSIDLFKCVVNNIEGNLASSALSAYLILSMCASGAKGNTALEMRDTLCLSNVNDLANFKYLIESLAKIPYITFGVINKIYNDKSVVVKETFKQLAKSFFHSEIEEVDFRTVNREESIKNINDWCAKRTNNKIEEILTINDVNHRTKMVLISAAYFRANWPKFDKFPKDRTTLEPFYVDRETVIDVATMHIRKKLYYKDLKDAECVALPFENRDFLLVIVVPKEIDGLKDIEKNLEKVDLNYQDDFVGCKRNMRDIHLGLPKFKIESTVNLNDYLEELGLIEMFSGDANFKGISDKPAIVPSLHVHKVCHKAVIEINEDGTENAEYTSAKPVGAGIEDTTVEWYELKVNRPFLFRIVNSSSNITLFSGRVAKPMYC